MRRWALCWLAIAISAASFSATAQQRAKLFRIGILSPAASSSTKAFDAFRDGLRELGYVDGSNIIIEYRLAAADYGQLPGMAADLFRSPVDHIVTDRPADCHADRASRPRGRSPSLQQQPAPIRSDSLAVSLAHPGGNVTGFTGYELGGKRLELLRRLFQRSRASERCGNPATGNPATSRLGWSPGDEPKEPDRRARRELTSCRQSTTNASL